MFTEVNSVEEEERLIDYCYHYDARWGQFPNYAFNLEEVCIKIFLIIFFKIMFHFRCVWCKISYRQK